MRSILQREKLALIDERNQTRIDLVRAENKPCAACAEEEKKIRAAQREEERALHEAKKSTLNTFTAWLQKKGT